MSRYPTGLRRFTLVSHDVGDGSKFDTAQLSGLLGAGGDDISPHLRWQGAPTPTLSYAVTMFDEHGLGDSGFWHWIVVDIPPGMTELRADAGHPSGRGLPNCARQLPNDLKLGRYIGAAPPLGDRPHTYRLSVHALDVVRLDISDDGTPARLRGKQPKLNPRQEAHLVGLLQAGEHSTAELADLFGVARSTVYRAQQRHQAAARP